MQVAQTLSCPPAMAMLVELLNTQASHTDDKPRQAALHRQCNHVLQQLQTADPLHSQYWTQQQQQINKQLTKV